MSNQEQPNIPQGFAVISDQKPFRIEEAEGFVRLYLHGTFESVEDNSKLITEIHAQSEVYNIIEVWVSSDGGYVTLLNEIIEALKRFQTVVTVCNSSASSAGAMIWGLGHLRVVSPFALMLWHRESYGFFGKTNQHEDQLEQQKKVFPLLMDYCVGDILSEEEIEKAKYTEIHKTGQELIESGHALSFEDYRNRMDQSMSGRFSDVGTLFYDSVRQSMVLADDAGNVRTVGDINTSPYKYSFFDIGMSNTVRLTIPDEETGEENTVTMSVEEFDDLDDQYIEIFEEIHGDSEEDDTDFGEEDLEELERFAVDDLSEETTQEEDQK